MRKRHLGISGKQSACGIQVKSNPDLGRYLTTDLSQVTCANCKATLAMAEAEIHQTRRRKVQ